MPIILPLYDWSWQESLSDYHYTSSKWFYISGMGLISLLMMYDGIKYSARRYNILIALAMIGVLLVPVNSNRWLHNSLAILFFVGNAYIVTYYSPLLPRPKKVLFALIISITLLMSILGVFNIYMAETIGMFSMTYFMYIRYYILELRRKTFV